MVNQVRSVLPSHNFPVHTYFQRRKKRDPKWQRCPNICLSLITNQNTLHLYIVNHSLVVKEGVLASIPSGDTKWIEARGALGISSRGGRLWKTTIGLFCPRIFELLTHQQQQHLKKTTYIDEWTVNMFSSVRIHLRHFHHSLVTWESLL